MSIAKTNNFKVLEDAAEGLGSEYCGNKCGSIGAAGVFSFHGTKTISTREGGILVTNDKELLERASILNDHGRDPKIGKTFWMENYGYKYKLSNLQAAMGCAQIKRIEPLIEKKRKVFDWYNEGFATFKGAKLNAEQDYAVNSYWMPTLVFDENLNINRDKLIEHLKVENIDSRPFFHPLSSLRMFEDKRVNEVAYRIGLLGINLPSYNELTKMNVDRVVSAVKKYIG